jgi:hypothetical protein
MTKDFTNASILLYIILILSGCKGDKHCSWEQDDQTQTVRHQYFSECVRNTKQANQNHEDNNGHIVDACENAAYYQSMKRVCEVEQ